MVQSGLWGGTFVDWVRSGTFIRAVYGGFGVCNQRLWHFFKLHCLSGQFRLRGGARGDHSLGER